MLAKIRKRKREEMRKAEAASCRNLPLHKKNDPLLPLDKKNYRPDSILPTISKIHEQGSRCRSPMSQFAIFFLDWRLKSASGDFFGA